MQNDSGTTENQRARSSEEPGRANQGQTSSISGVDLNHPPRDLENLSDTSKRFLAGMVREGFTQGLEACQRGTVGRDKISQLRFADKWIAGNVPFLNGVIGDVGEGSSSGR